jgi:WD40 repeat protein
MKKAMVLAFIAVVISLAWLAFSRHYEALRQASVAATARAEASAYRNQATEAQSTAIAERHIQMTTQAEVAELESRVTALTAAQATVELKAQAEAKALLEQSDGRRLQAEARWLADQAGTALDNTAQGLIRGTLLAVESMRRTPTLEGDRTLHQALALLPRPVLELPHPGYVEAAAFSPDGRWLATGAWDHTARVWEVATGREMARLKHTDKVLGLAFSPDGRRLATQSGQTAYVWEIATGVELARMEHEDRVRAIAFSPDGRRLATGSWDDTARLWDAATGQELARMPHAGDVYSLAFSPDGHWLATGSWDNQARIWEAVTGQEVAQLPHDGPVYQVAFGPAPLKQIAGQWIATASGDGTARLWLLVEDEGGAVSLAEIARLEHEDEVSGVAFSPAQPDGPNRPWLGTMSGNLARVWRVQMRRVEEGTPVQDMFTVSEIANLVHDNQVYALAFSPTAPMLATGNADHTARVWDVTPRYDRVVSSGWEVARMPHTAPVGAVAFSPDGRWLGTVSNRMAQVWEADPALGLEVARLSHGGPIGYMDFSADGRQLTTTSQDGALRVWDVAAGEVRERLEVEKGLTVVSPGGQWLATGYGGAPNPITMTVRTRRTGREVAQVSYSEYKLDTLTLSPDGRWLAAHDFRGLVWDVVAERQIAELDIPYRAYKLLFSPDGQWLAAASGEPTMGYLGAVKTWRLKYNAAQDLLSFHPVAYIKYQGPANDIAFSPDGRWLLTGSDDGTAHLLEVDSGKVVGQLEHKTGVTAVAFSPDGQRLATISDGAIEGMWANVIRIWQFAEAGAGEAPTLREVAHLVHRGQIGKMAFGYRDSGVSEAARRHWGQIGKVVLSPDGQYLAFVEEDNSVRVWRWQPADLVAEACERLPRNLTREEWAQYMGDYEPYRPTCPGLETPPSPQAKTQAAAARPVPTLSPAPTRPLSVQPTTPISPGNVEQVGELARWGKGRANDFAWTSDGQLAVATAQGIHLYRALGGTAGAGLAPDTSAWSLAFSPDGRQMALGNSQRVELWDVTKGRLVKTLQTSARQLAFSPDGALLAVADHYRLEIWQVADGQLLHTFIMRAEWLLTIAYSPDSEILASGSDKERIHLWRVTTGELMRVLDVPAYDLGFSPDGKTLASVDRDGVKVWRVADGTLLKTLSERSAGVRAVAFSPDGATLATGGTGDQAVQLWQVADWTLAQTLEGLGKSSVDLAFSPDGMTLASRSFSGAVSLVNLFNQGVSYILEDYAGEIRTVALSPDSTILASGSADGQVRLQRVADGKTLRVLSPQPGSVEGVTFSPDGTMLASFNRAENVIRLWRVADGKLIRVLQGHSDRVESVAFSPDGTLLASGGDSDDKTVRVWRVANGEAIHILEAHDYGANGVAFSPDGKTLAAAGWDIRLWDVASGELLQTWDPDDIALQLAFSPDGTTVFVETHEVIQLWDVNAGKLVYSLYESPAQGYYGGTENVTFSPDGVLLVSGGDSVRLWRVADGAYLRGLPLGEGRATSVAFSRDGTLIAAGLSDGTLRLWGVDPLATSPDTPPVTPASPPTVGGGGGQIAFMVWTRGGISPSSQGLDVFAVDVDGSNYHNAGVYWTKEFAWSPDGQQFAVLERDAYNGGGAIYVSNADGSDWRRLIDGEYYELAWSPDNSQLAFCCGPYNAPGIYVINVDGTGLRWVTEVSTGYPRGLAWSPNGHHILFNSTHEESGDIYVVEMDSGSLRQLTTHAADDRDAIWSPDGRQIAFVSERDGDPEIYLMAADGSHLRNLTRHNAPAGPPVWSPDSRQILFASTREGHSGIYIIETDGSRLRRLTQGQGDNEPAWSPDGTQVAFSSGRDGNPEIYLMDGDGSNVRRLTYSVYYDRGPVWQP